MSKKKKEQVTEEVKNQPEKTDVKADANLGKAKVKDDKAKTKKKKERKHTLSKKTKETVSELKKVTWPTFPEVVKRTGVVLVVVIIFAIILFGLDMLFGYLFGLLKSVAPNV